MSEAGRLCPSCQTPIPGDARVCPSCGAISLPGAHGTLGERLGERLRAALGQRYRIERQIGQGGMAVVYLAHDLRHDRPVALKLLRPELATYVGAERFLREIRFAAQLTHPHILTLHDSGEAAGLLFYVMPYVEGESLRQRLGRQGALPVEDAVRLAAEVADGLAYAHDLGIIHRDIKPENILLAHEHAAIADFGIARALEGASETITATGFSPGTPLYMSPEQAAGDHSLDRRADIYSLGCVLYEMLTGKPPYPGPTPQAFLAQHAMHPVPSARAARREVSPALDAAVRKAMAKERTERFQTAADFCDALRQLQAAAGAARAPARRAPAWRRPALAIGGLLAVAAAAALLFRPRPASPPQAPRRFRVVVQPFTTGIARLRGTAARLTEALSHRLEEVPALDMVAGPVVAQLRDVSLDSLRARYQPDRIIMGRLEQVAGRLQATAQIVNAATGTALGDSAVARPGGAAAAEALAEPLSVFVRHAFWSELETEARRARVGNPEAWSLVESARDRVKYAGDAVTLRLDRQGFQALDVADSLLALAHGRDPGSALISIDEARIEERRGFYAEYLRQVLQTLPPGLPSPAASYARALDDLDRLARSRHQAADSADVFELRGRVKEALYREGGADSMLDGAIADFRAATEVDRHRATAWQELGSAYGASGLYDDALLAIQHAFEEDAFRLRSDQLLRARFDAALRAGKYGVAEQACRAGAADWPGSELFRDCEVQLWSRTRGDRRSAEAARRRTDSLAADETNPLLGVLRELWVAEILARSGLGDSADRVARRAAAKASATWLPLLLPEEAYLRVLRNDPDSALGLIAAAVRLDPTSRRTYRNLPWFGPLRADPRFLTAVGGAPAS